MTRSRRMGQIWRGDASYGHSEAGDLLLTVKPRRQRKNDKPVVRQPVRPQR